MIMILFRQNPNFVHAAPWWVLCVGGRKRGGEGDREGEGDRQRGRGKERGQRMLLMNTAQDV